MYTLKKGLRYTALIVLAGCDGECGDVATVQDIGKDLTVSVSPIGQDIAQGTSAQFTVTLERTGFSGPVKLQAWSEVPAGTTITFEPAVVPAGSSTSLATVTLAPDAVMEYDGSRIASKTVNIRAQADGLIDRFGSLRYQPTLSSEAGFTISATPPTLTFARGKSGDALLMVNRLGNFKGPITITASSVYDGVSATVVPFPGQADTYLVRVNLAATTFLDPLTRSVDIVASAAGLRNRTFNLGIFVIDNRFQLSASREPRLQPGSQDTATVTIGRGSNFSAPVTLSFENVPPGITGTFGTNPANEASPITLRAAASVVPGDYSVVIRGVAPTESGAPDHTHVLKFKVDAALVPNAYTLIPPNMSVIAGSNATSIFNVTRSSGFAEPITVNFARANGTALPAGLTVSLDQNPITGAFTLVRVNTTDATPAGTYVMTATGVAKDAVNVTANFNIVVTARPVPTSITIGKLVNGVPQATTSETFAVSQTLPLRAVVLDQNGQGMPGETVTWTSTHPTNALVSDNGDVYGFGPGAATIFATSKTNTAIRSSVSVTVVASPTTNVTRMVLEPGNAEITAPAAQQYAVAFYNSAGVKIDPEAGTTVKYSSSNPTIATVNDSTGIVKGVAAGTVTIAASYSKNGVTIRESNAQLLVYAAGSAGHYGSAYISTNSNNTRTVRAGQILLFQLYVFDVNNVQKPSGITPAPVITSSNTSVVTITPSTITGGYFYNMVFAPGTAPGTTVKIRYDVAGAGGEITMTIVP